MNTNDPLQAVRDRLNAPKPEPVKTPIQQSTIRRITFQKEIVRSLVWNTCLNCEDWSDGVRPHHSDKTLYPVGCVRFKELPPPEIIVYGCEDHMTDIPF